MITAAASSVCSNAPYLMLSRIDATGPMTARELSTAMQLEISTVTRQVGAMLRERLVDRILDPDGGPTRRLRVTTTGATRLGADRERYHTGLGKVVAEWPDTERAISTACCAH